MAEPTHVPTCANKQIEQDDDSKKSHPAAAAVRRLRFMLTAREVTRVSAGRKSRTRFTAGRSKPTLSMFNEMSAEALLDLRKAQLRDAHHRTLLPLPATNASEFDASGHWEVA
jgi:hypothetical protein